MVMMMMVMIVMMMMMMMLMIRKLNLTELQEPFTMWKHNSKGLNSIGDYDYYVYEEEWRNPRNLKLDGEKTFYSLFFPVLIVVSRHITTAWNNY